MWNPPDLDTVVWTMLGYDNLHFLDTSELQQCSESHSNVSVCDAGAFGVGESADQEAEASRDQGLQSQRKTEHAMCGFAHIAAEVLSLALLALGSSSAHTPVFVAASFRPTCRAQKSTTKKVTIRENHTKENGDER